ncbi:hypothetical protein BGX34_005661, partial [Mortierella sp. NVP85]
MSAHLAVHGTRLIIRYIFYPSFFSNVKIGVGASQEAGWNDAISADRKGAGYFLSQTRNFCLRPQDYIKRDQSSCLIDEWTRWLSELRTNPHGGVRRAAVAASPLTQQNLDEYYRDQFFVDRELDVLESSSQQLKTADQQYTSHLLERRRHPAVSALTPSSTTHDLDTAAEVTNPSAERETAKLEISAEKGLAASLETIQGSDHLEEVDISSSEDEPGAHHLEISQSQPANTITLSAPNLKRKNGSIHVDTE